jgi:hypothetical protein
MPTTGELGNNPTGSPSNPVPTDTGQSHSPDRGDYEKNERHKKVTRDAEQVEDRQSKEYWTSKEKERKAAQKAERDAAALKAKTPKAPKAPKGKKNKGGGVEIPKQGMGRLGTAHKGLGRISSSEDSGGGGYGGASAYADPFAGSNDLRGMSMGGFGGGGGRGGGGMGFHVDMGSYADPFASLTPGKRGRKPKDSYDSPFAGMNIGLQRGRGRPPKSLLNLRLF